MREVICIAHAAHVAVVAALDDFPVRAEPPSRMGRLTRPVEHMFVVIHRHWMAHVPLALVGARMG
jgi:hypothetical protein